MKVFLLVALLCVIPLISGKAVDEATSKCLVNYLKNHGFLGKNHTYQKLPANCVQIVNDVKNAELEKYREYYQKHNETANNVDCIIRNMNEKAAIDRELIHLLDLSQANVTEEILKDLESVVPMRTMIEIVKIQYLCNSTTSLEETAVILYDRNFNGIFKQNYVSKLRKAEADYCVRKHLQDKGSLDDSIQV
jgi:hypothetical protein